MYYPAFRLLIALLMSALIFGCESEEKNYTPQLSDTPVNQTETFYTLGVHPLHNPTKLLSVYGPLADYLSSHLPGITIRVEASKDYPSYDIKLEQEAFHLTLPNPFQTINSLDHQYQVINQVGEQALFKGIILVRKDSQITRIKQLEGKKIAYPAPTALAATMMPQHYLHTQGLDLKKTETLYVGSQESSIMNVYFKHTAASATWPIPWLDLQKNKPEIAKDLKVAWQTDTLPNNSFMYHKSKVPEQIALKIQKLLSTLHTHDEGKLLLEAMNVGQIYQASDETYLPVKSFVKTFRHDIGDNALLASTKVKSN